jgi:hypothetical protein
MVMPDWLQGPLDRALGDLQGDAPIPLEVTFDGADLDVREAAGTHAVGVWVGEARGEELTVRIADQLIDQFFPESNRTWGQARPLCPGHTHPAEPHLRDGEAWWICPRDRRPLARIGELAQPATASQRA